MKEDIRTNSEIFFSSILLHCPSLFFSIEEKKTGKWIEQITKYGSGALVQLANNETYCDFRLKTKLASFGYNHPLLIKASIEHLLKPYPSEEHLLHLENQWEKRLTSLFSPLGKWHLRVGEISHKKELSAFDCTKIISLNAISEKENLHLYNFNPFSHLYFLDERVRYITMDNITPIPITLYKSRSDIDKNKDKKKYPAEFYYLTQLTINLLYECNILSIDSKIIKMIQMIEQSLKKEFPFCNIYQKGLELVICFDQNRDAQKFRKHLWQKGFLTSLIQNEIHISPPFTTLSRHLEYCLLSIKEILKSYN